MNMHYRWKGCFIKYQLSLSIYQYRVSETFGRGRSRTWPLPAHNAAVAGLPLTLRWIRAFSCFDLGNFKSIFLKKEVFHAPAANGNLK